MYLKGHPNIIYNPNTTDLSSYFSLVKCRVLPTTDLFHPVLPFWHEDKLMFPVGCSCVEANLTLLLLARTTICQHTDEQHTLTSTWCTLDVEEAVHWGYKIVKICEIWDFYYPQTGLFKDNLNTWLQMKEEAVGQRNALLRSNVPPSRRLRRLRRGCVGTCQH